LLCFYQEKRPANPLKMGLYHAEISQICRCFSVLDFLLHHNYPVEIEDVYIIE
jgi:hypothetical protein